MCGGLESQTKCLRRLPLRHTLRVVNFKILWFHKAPNGQVTRVGHFDLVEGPALYGAGFPNLKKQCVRVRFEFTNPTGSGQEQRNT